MAEAVFVHFLMASYDKGIPQAQENSLAQDAFAIARPFSFCCQHGLAVTEGIRSQTIEAD